MKKNAKTDCDDCPNMWAVRYAQRTPEGWLDLNNMRALKPRKSENEWVEMVVMKKRDWDNYKKNWEVSCKEHI